MQMPTYHQHERQTLLKAKQRQDWKTSKGVVHMYGGIDYEEKIQKLDAEDAVVHELVDVQFQPVDEEVSEKLSDLRHMRKLMQFWDADAFAKFEPSDDEVFRDVPGWIPGI